VAPLIRDRRAAATAADAFVAAVALVDNNDSSDADCEKKKKSQQQRRRRNTKTKNKNDARQKHYISKIFAKGRRNRTIKKITSSLNRQKCAKMATLLESERIYRQLAAKNLEEGANEINIEEREEAQLALTVERIATLKSFSNNNLAILCAMRKHMIDFQGRARDTVEKMKAPTFGEASVLARDAIKSKERQKLIGHQYEILYNYSNEYFLRLKQKFASMLDTYACASLGDCAKSFEERTAFSYGHRYMLSTEYLTVKDKILKQLLKSNKMEGLSIFEKIHLKKDVNKKTTKNEKKKKGGGENKENEGQNK